ncbi:hypothetical protein FRC19_010279 [Serendipita sp. 401]|nr:hypothetical protein FRC19_010279 [Serendipita sp. 401]KAG9052428.1 hypothetical protein FS842_009880 [Serendipita sp. 407]
MGYHADSKLSINTNFKRQPHREETGPPQPGRRRGLSNFPSTSSSIFSSTSPSSSSSRPSSFIYLPVSTPQPTTANLPLNPIDSETFPSPLDTSNMYKVPGQNVYFVPYGGSPMGSHPAWSAGAASAPPFVPFVEPIYFPGAIEQPSQPFFDDASHAQVGFPNNFESEDEEYRSYASDGDKRSRRLSRGYFTPLEATSPTSLHTIESRVYTKIDPRHRPPPSVSPANSSATDDSGRSSSYGSTGSGRSVRWHEDLVAPTPPPNRPRPKGWFNRRGDQLWCNDGRYKAAIEEYPPYLREYPEVGDGWMNEYGVRITMTHRRVPDAVPRALKGVLKNNAPLGF